MAISGLGRKLVNDGLLSRDDAERLFEECQKEGVHFVSRLISSKLITASKLADVASAEFGLPLLDLNAINIDLDTVKLVDDKLLSKHHVLPLFKRGSRIFIAVSDPTNLIGIDAIKFHVGLTVEPVVVEEDKLLQMLVKVAEDLDTSMGDLAGDESLDDLDVAAVDDDKTADDDSAIDDAPVVRYINKMLLDAIKAGVSDLHFEPYEKRYRVRFRLDGMLKEVSSPPVALAGKLSARFKVMARLDIAERRVPQDGRIKLTLSKTKSIDFRVNTCPTLFGEKIVLRILDSDSAKLGIDMLGYEPEQKQLYLDNLEKPYGMILVTGPTGSGKTVSLYTGLNILNTEDRNISTAEDPVEINLEGINQVNVNDKVGLTFAAALKAFLRQDPDVIMVGEIRDITTAEIAIKAAQTGHMVLSTLHTNDAPQTLSRLINIGVAPFNIASAVNLIIAQRLARRLCKHCKTLDDLPEKVLLKAGYSAAEIPTLKIYKAVGCDQCNEGYKGRVGIYQVMPISEQMGRLIMEERTAIDLADQARKEGIPDLRQSALKKVKDGLTSLAEANRVTLE
ncbi:MAG: type IV-A pilus assembly ATPase PilB [Gammaproteobacteria bacterium]|nr:type IV-A pilus assembly ATPase PilB [Gammaproteobacteria bacterium]